MRLKGWKISLHGETTVHPVVLNVWGESGILEKTGEHSKRRINASNGPSVNPLSVEGVKVVMSDGLEDFIEVTLEAEMVFLYVGVDDGHILNLWVEDEVFHGHVACHLEVGLDNGNFLIGN